MMSLKKILYLGGGVDPSNTTIEPEGERFCCIIDKPSGYDDPEKSGKPITLSVSTASFTSGNEPSDEKEKKDKTAVANITVCTLGPALTGTVIKESDKDSILVQWNEVQGAYGYKIYRTKYASNGTGGWTPEKVDVYYKDAGTSGEFRISEGEGTIDKKTTCTSTAGVYTLRDAYADSYGDKNQYSVKNVEICPANFCKRSKYPTIGIGMKISKNFHGMPLPNRTKIGVAGCRNACSSVYSKDIGEQV